MLEIDTEALLLYTISLFHDYLVMAASFNPLPLPARIKTVAMRSFIQSSRVQAA